MWHDGGCQCGRIRYRLSGPLPPAYACHCGECKKQSASAFSLSLVVLADRFVCEQPTAWFETRSYSGATKRCHFCPQCGTRLWHESSHAPDLLTVKAGTLDQSQAIAPRAHLWVRMLQAGISLDPDVPAFDTQPDDFATWRRRLV